MINIESEGNTVCTMFQSNYDRTIGSKLQITVFTSTAGDLKLVLYIKLWNQPERFLKVSQEI